MIRGFKEMIMSEQQQRLFKDGDVVRLKSGGPKMTIVGFDKYSDADLYKCQWFDKDHRLDGLFTEASLENAAPGETSKLSGPTSKSPWS